MPKSPCRLKRVYAASNADEAEQCLAEFEGQWDVADLPVLARRNIGKKWTMPIRDGKAAMTRFTIQFEERMYRL